jgi:hypothetical protein
MCCALTATEIDIAAPNRISFFILVSSIIYTD